MAQKCAICGAEINVFQSQKLTDGNYICRKTCKKLGMKEFDYMHSDLPAVLAHNEQVAEGTKIFNDLFVPRMKTKEAEKKLKRFGNLFVAPDLGLCALAEPAYKFFIFGKYWPRACVYRTGDLYSYEIEETTKMVDGKPQKEIFMNYAFANTKGMYTFKDKVPSGTPIVKYFNSVFGIEKTLKNVGNTWKNQINAIGAMGKAIGEAVKSGGEATEDVVNAAGDAADMMNVAIYGDRTALIAAADKTLAEFEAQG